MSRPEFVRVRSLDDEGAGSGLPGTRQRALLGLVEHAAGPSRSCRPPRRRAAAAGRRAEGPAGRPRRGAPDAGEGAPRRLIVARRRLGCRGSVCRMCGIIAIVSREPGRPTPTAAELLDGLDRAIAAIGDPSAVAAAVEAVDEALHGLPGVLALADRHDLVAGLTTRLDQLDGYAQRGRRSPGRERRRRAGCARGSERRVDPAARRDVGDPARPAAHGARGRGAQRTRQHRRRPAGYLAVQQALSALDRLEVRGRDSAGLHLFVWNHGLSMSDPAVRRLFERNSDPLFQNGSVRAVPTEERVSASCTRPRRRSASSATTRRSAPQSPRTAAAPRPVQPRRQAHRARPHSLGQRRHHQRGQLPSR